MKPQQLGMPDLGGKYEPHWLWATCFIFVPFCMTAIGFVGLSPELFVPLSVAELAPRLAVLVSLGGMTAALMGRRRVALAIAAVGFAISLGGFLLLLWLG